MQIRIYVSLTYFIHSTVVWLVGCVEAQGARSINIIPFDGQVMYGSDLRSFRYEIICPQFDPICLSVQQLAVLNAAAWSNQLGIEVFLI